MKYEKKIFFIILTCIILTLFVGYLLIGNLKVFINNRNLSGAIQSINTETVYINNIVPFEWDILYTFKPYSSKEEIEEIVGFKSSAIKANNINEDMVYLLFVKDEKVVANIRGYACNLGYSIDFMDKIEFDEDALFNVEKIEGNIRLSYLN